jgi:hypothetical protein
LWLGGNLGAGFASLAVLYWLPPDALVSLLVGAMTWAWSSLPLVPFGPGHGWLAGMMWPWRAWASHGRVFITASQLFLFRLLR